jgi:hypothetical protein
VDEVSGLDTISFAVLCPKHQDEFYTLFAIGPEKSVFADDCESAFLQDSN